MFNHIYQQYAHNLHLNTQTPDFPVDAVVTWVDGDDPVWLEIKNYYITPSSTQNQSKTHASMRWSNLNELYYCLLSIIHYLPWINNIFLITMRPQTPNYINQFPKVKIIHHDQIYPNTSHLPTFNSHSIESQLHNIPGLAEHFIYFNDDMFIGKPLSKSYFFSEKGEALYFKRPIINTAMRKVKSLIKESFMLKPYDYAPVHMTLPLRKTDMKLAWEIIPERLQKTSARRFRHPNDIWIIGFIYNLCRLWETCERKSLDPNDHLYLKGDSLRFQSLESLKQFLEVYRNTNPSLLCLSNLDNSKQKHQCFFKHFAKIFMQKLKNQSPEFVLI